MQQIMGDQNGKEGDRGVQDGSHRRVDGLLAPRDQEEGNGYIGNPQDQQRSPFLAAARQLHTLDENDCDAKEQSEESAEGDQRDRTNFLHGDLDPHEGGTPDRAKQYKYKPMFRFHVVLLIKLRWMEGQRYDATTSGNITRSLPLLISVTIPSSSNLRRRRSRGVCRPCR